MDFALRHDDHKIGHGHGFALVMGDNNGRDTQFLLQLLKLNLHAFAQLGVKGRERLIQQEQFWFQRQGPGNGHPLFLSARQF